MLASRSGVLERVRHKELCGPLQSCTLLLQMPQLDHLESALWRDAYSVEFPTQIGSSGAEFGGRVGARRSRQAFPRAHTPGSGWVRSEERRVGKECRSRWSPYH